MNTTRTRFAPSPTGALHMGVVRSALFAWLLARHNGGQFLLRIEDTDQKREVVGSADSIVETLDWLGLDRDEDSLRGGPHAPYTQSQRLEIYQRYARQLVDAGIAYTDPYTPEELTAFRDAAVAEKRPFLYREHRPLNPPAWDGTQALRIKLEPQAQSWDDAVLGRVEMGPEMIDDYIIMKADGYPTYNFAHIVDDYEMEITHVLRSQEFISSIPKYLATQAAMDIPAPINAIVPPVLGETGGPKLSKRKGAQPVLHYREAGYLPEALLNYMAALGWNDGTEKELYTRDELVASFDLAKVQKGPARFDEQRLLWMNGQWIRRLDLGELARRAESFWPEAAVSADQERRLRVLGLVQERIKTLAEIPLLTNYFFAEPSVDLSLIHDNKQLKKLTDQEIRAILTASHAALETVNSFEPEAIQSTLNTLLEESGQKPAVLFGLIRVVTTWAPFSPALHETLALLGKQTTLGRISKALETIG